MKYRMTVTDRTTDKKNSRMIERTTDRHKKDRMIEPMTEKGKNRQIE